MTVVLIDAKNALFRFGYVHKNLKASSGQRTGALYGILGCLLRLKKKYPDGRFLMVWDGENKHKGWRKKLYPEYQANRHTGEKPPEVIAALSQIELIKKITEMIGIWQVQVDTLEADDLIGILSTRCMEDGHQAVVYSSDKDFVQLMKYGVTLIRSGFTDKEDKLAVETSKTVFKKFGCKISDVLKVRAIAGDSSDGIPNPVRGIGTKTAVDVLDIGVDFATGKRPWMPSTQKMSRADKAASKLFPVWDQVLRNYRLMKIPRTVDDKRLVGCRGDLNLAVSQAMVSLVLQARRVGYEEFVLALAELDMVEAVGVRDRLWGVQRVGGGSQPSGRVQKRA